MNKWIFIVLYFLYFCCPAICLEYDYSSTKCIPIYLNITKEISTNMPILEGQSVDFRSEKTISDGEQIIIKRGDIISGRIETIITSGMNGFPAEIILDNFNIPNINQSQLIGTYVKTGINRCLWVYPLKWILTPFPPTGTLTNFIKGGNAKIKTSDLITIYYYPDWK